MTRGLKKGCTLEAPTSGHPMRARSDGSAEVDSASSHLKGDLGPAQGLQWNDLLVSGIWPGKAFFCDWPGEALPSSQQLAHRPNPAFCLLEPWLAKFLGREASCLARYRPLFLVTSGDQ